MENESLRPLDFGGQNGGRKEKLDLRFVRAASHRELGHWIAILDLDPAHALDNDGFVDWLEKSNLDVRVMESDGGLVVRKRGASFFFLNPPTVGQCERELQALKQEIRRQLGSNPPNSPKPQ